MGEAEEYLKTNIYTLNKKPLTEKLGYNGSSCTVVINDHESYIRDLKYDKPFDLDKPNKLSKQEVDQYAMNCYLLGQYIGAFIAQNSANHEEFFQCILSVIHFKHFHDDTKYTIKIDRTNSVVASFESGSLPSGVFLPKELDVMIGDYAKSTIDPKLIDNIKAFGTLCVKSGILVYLRGYIMNYGLHANSDEVTDFIHRSSKFFELQIPSIQVTGKIDDMNAISMDNDAKIRLFNIYCMTWAYNRLEIGDEIMSTFPSIYRREGDKYRFVACLPPTELLQNKVNLGEIDSEILSQVKSVKEEFKGTEFIITE